jgi:hypothetical protein
MATFVFEVELVIEALDAALYPNEERKATSPNSLNAGPLCFEHYRRE